MPIRQTIVTLPANVSTRIAASTLDRNFFGVQVIGMGNVNINFGAAAVVDSGWSMDAAAAAGRQGGGLTMEGLLGPFGDVFAISAAGSTVVVLEG